MTRERFKFECHKAGIIGAVWRYTSRLFWVPETRQLIRFMYDTDGSQLVEEDEFYNVNDYIDYQIYDFDGVEIEPGDAGLYMFNNEEETDIIELTWQCLENEIFAKGNVPDGQWLED